MTHTYNAGFVKDLEAREEFARVQKALNDAQPEFIFSAREAAPKRTFPHMVVVAGANWDPGYGPGTYKRNSANDGWLFLGPYIAGSGGTVTQLTNKATGVTLSKACGEITMNAAALAADTTVSFTLTNTLIAAADYLAVKHSSGGTLGSYTVTSSEAAGSAVIYVRNVTGGSLSEAIVIKFQLHKGATS